MGIIALKCTNCGDNTHCDDSKQKAFCSSCGAENLIVQDIVNIHNTTQNIYHTNKTIIGREKTEAEEFTENGKIFLGLKDYAKAATAFYSAVISCPADYRGWLGMATVALHLPKKPDMSDKDKRNSYEYKLWTQLPFVDKSPEEYFEQALAVADEEQKAEINQSYIPYAEQKKQQRIRARKKWRTISIPAAALLLTCIIVSIISFFQLAKGEEVLGAILLFLAIFIGMPSFALCMISVGVTKYLRKYFRK